MPPQQPNNMNADQKRRTTLIRLSVGGALFIVVLLIIGVITASQSSTITGLGAVQARNTEILRIIDEQGKNISSQTVKNRAARISIVLKSDNRILTQLGTVASVVPSSGIEAQLTDSLANNQFDVVIDNYFDTILSANITDLQAAIAGAKNEESKTTLNNMLESLESL